MTYCESAQKDCPYLGDANIIKDNLTLARAVPVAGFRAWRLTTKRQYERHASKLENGVESIIEDSIQSCDVERCGLLALAVQTALVINAERQLDK